MKRKLFGLTGCSVISLDKNYWVRPFLVVPDTGAVRLLELYSCVL